MKILEISGFKVLYERKPVDIATVRAVFNCGSVDEVSESDYGVAHFLEHMFFKGTEKKTYKEINSEISQMGYGNAYTDYGKTVYHIHCMNGDYSKALRLLCEMIFTPSMLEEEFQKERNVILEECQTCLDNPQSYFYNNTYHRIFGDYAHDIVGSKKTVSEMNIQQLKRFRQEHYTKNNMCFAIVGNIDECDLMIEGLSIFSDYEQSVADGGYDGKYKEFVPVKKDILLEHSAEQSFLGLFFRSWADFDLKSCNFVNEVFENGFGGGSHSMLFDRIREQLGLCYSIFSFGHGCRKSKATGIMTMLHKNNIDLAKNEILRLLDDVKKNGFSKKLLETSKKSAIFNIAEQIDTSDKYAYLFCDKFFMNGVLDFASIKKSLESITNEDVIKYANWIAETGYQTVYMNKED